MKRCIFLVLVFLAGCTPVGGGGGGGGGGGVVEVDGPMMSASDFCYAFAGRECNSAYICEVVLPFPDGPRCLWEEECDPDAVPEPPNTLSDNLFWTLARGCEMRLAANNLQRLPAADADRCLKSLRPDRATCPALCANGLLPACDFQRRPGDERGPVECGCNNGGASLGEACSFSGDCASGVCIQIGEGDAYCSRECVEACESGFICQAVTEDEAYCVRARDE